MAIFWVFFGFFFFLGSFFTFKSGKFDGTFYSQNDKKNSTKKIINWWAVPLRKAYILTWVKTLYAKTSFKLIVRNR